jgi:hypothetical protein
VDGHLDTFCPECDATVRAALRDRKASVTVRNEVVSFVEVVAVCPLCGETIGDSRVEGPNIMRAYDVYRARHGMLFSYEISGVRRAYGLSLREFGRFVGLDERSCYRYERGDLATLGDDAALRSAMDADGARALLVAHGEGLSERSRALVKERIRVMSSDGGRLRPKAVAPAGSVVDGLMSMPPSVDNGFHRFDPVETGSLASVLAVACHGPSWTRLQRAMFFCDRVWYERQSVSMTGLVYVGTASGPVIMHGDEMRRYLVEQGSIRVIEVGWGEAIMPAREVRPGLDDDRRAVALDVAHFVDLFGSARELSDYMRTTRSWSLCSHGDVIRYGCDGGFGEVGHVLCDRLRNPLLGSVMSSG